MNTRPGAWPSGQRMPPYSTDPELSRQRHAAPDYSNSSDPMDLPNTSTSDVTMLDAIEPSPIPSSPPKQEIDADVLRNEQDDDEPTDDDEDGGIGTSPSYVTSLLANGRSAFSESTLRAGSFTLAARVGSTSNLSPEEIIARVFDSDGSTDINFDNRGLAKVPPACRDLADHEDLGRRLFKLDLQSNNIRKLDRFVYDIRRLEYLNLRQNELQELSPLICQLEYLQELILANNCLRTLPAELLDLPRLRTLTTYPNAFYKPPPDGELEKLVVSKRFPNLIELAQRKIAQAASAQPFPEFERLIQQLCRDVPQLPVGRLSEPILESVAVGRICSICRAPLIKPAAVLLRWQKHSKDKSGETIPFTTSFCSASCFVAPVTA